MTELPGVDLTALARWMDAEHPGLRGGELAGSVLAGGKSNLTYRVGDGTSIWALRRPPLAHVLPTAHDMVREYRVISALASTKVPVPEAVTLCTDPAVLGAPFYLMGFIDGLVFDKTAAMAQLNPALAQTACEHLVDTLVELHSVDPASVGLSDFGRPEGFMKRQVRRWHQQWQSSKTRELDTLERVATRLGETIPEPSDSAIVHGDYRLTNVMFRADLTSIAAVVDWEMATLGDPLSDVGLLMVYQELAAQDDFVMPKMNPGDGFLTAEQLLQRYGDRSHRDLSQMHWYVAFGYFKLAIIAEGIHHRYLQGKTVGAGFSHFGAAVPTLVTAAAARLKD